MLVVTDPVNCLFSVTISPNIEPVGGKMCGHIISSVRRDNLTTHFAANRLNIRRYCEQKYKLTGSVTHGIYCPLYNLLSTWSAA